MGVISRGVKNAFRNGVRTTSIIFILALSIAMSLIMLLALKTVDAKISSVKGSIGNTITISPAGVRGFEGGGTLLTDANVTDVKGLSHVVSTIGVLSDRLESASTNLISSIEPGEFGNRQKRQENSSVSSNNTSANQSFTMPVMVSATSDINSLSSLNVSELTLTSGDKIDASSSENIAMLGKDLASKNGLSVGSTFKAYDQDIKVVGIYDTGNTFTNGSVLMPLKTLQNLSSQTGQVNQIVVTTDSIDNLSSVETAIKDKIGSDKVDVVSSQDQSQNAVTPLENIKTISTYSLVGSIIAGSIIILLTMVMIVRERRREIGVLKAIGSSNTKIMAQFISEALTLTLISSLAGIILGLIFSNPVLKIMVTNTESSVSTGGPGRVMGGGGGAMMLKIGNGTGNALREMHAVIGWDIILYGFLAAIIIAIIGSAIPSFLISKVRPAEVMRAE
ncbi:TPA: ABC transporter permease [Candidatus Berkelbacteria bacterium]|uniref:ABC transporter permease, putative ABC transport system permease protein n=1 Tax=Berkelbacteria bacterium GW2011_GWE1_39_12 TaxID=1618337 RepID=A0A0G4B5E8_9BACT|nr:MAG: ABC transporter permease, putative ABC transport system permease protein [Berkelbacteria bacterium GW2011_GWE1_39_12]HBO60265.1 ABC transporter permease [Candidatus Berkelbacteria bacterium]